MTHRTRQRRSRQRLRAISTPAFFPKNLINRRQLTFEKQLLCAGHGSVVVCAFSLHLLLIKTRRVRHVCWCTAHRKKRGELRKSSHIAIIDIASLPAQPLIDAPHDLIVSAGRAKNMFGDCRGSIWRKDDFTRCFRNEYVHIRGVVDDAHVD